MKLLIQLVRGILHLSGKCQVKVREFQTPMAVATMYKACTQFQPKFKRYVPFNPDGFQKLIRSDILVTGLFINKACTVDKQVSGEH